MASERGILYPRAATLGGCTEHNAMITMLPDNEDWNHIANVTDDPSWRADKMHAFFRRLEKCHYSSKGGHGQDGWLPTEQNDISLALKDGKFAKIALAALQSEGIFHELADYITQPGMGFKMDPNHEDYLEHKTDGVMNVPKATQNGIRKGLREFILDTAKRTSKLKIATTSHVKKLVFSADNKRRVIGVEYVQGKNLYEASPLSSRGNLISARQMFARAQKEVILSAGAFNTPQLLKLSGIGDEDELNKFSIPTRMHLPGVGKNLQDRYEVSLVSEMKSDYKSLERCKFDNPSFDACFKEYQMNPAKSLYGSNGVLISMVKRSKRELDRPDLMIFATPGDFRGYSPGYSKRAFNAKRFTLTILKAHTDNAQGEVNLKSKNPFVKPDINFNYFKDGEDFQNDDMKALIAGIKMVRRANNFFPLKGAIRQELFPGEDIKAQAALQKHISKEAWGHHASCSCKMGSAADPMAVVDSQFKVHGMDNLRVVDASIFPKIPGMFIVLPIYMASEKAADVIIERWS